MSDPSRSRHMPASAQLNGILILDKPAGPGSAQCLRALKRQGQRKIGHAGTLDPMASGVLPVLLGQATKLSGWLLRCGRKVYSGVIRLGVETDTWDMQGRILVESPTAGITAGQIEAEIAAWLEMEEQQVPAYSAAKHNGQPLYKLARQGRDTPVKIKKVRIFEAGMLSCDMPHVAFRVATGSGAYIRSLAHSLGKRLGCGAALVALRREYSHPFSIDQAVTLAELEAGIMPGHVLPLADALPHWPRVELAAAQASAARNGMPVDMPDISREICGGSDYAFLFYAGEPLAIGQKICANGKMAWRIERGLWQQAQP